MIRLGTGEDYRRIVQMTRYQDHSYINKTLLKQDLLNSSLFLIEEDGKIKVVCSLVYDSKYNMYYIKRLFVSKQALGKGYAKLIMKEVIRLNNQLIAVTPFVDNVKMIHIVKELGFKFKYTFLDNYALYVYS